MSEFGQRIRKRREELGWNQDELAKKISLKSGKQTISRWESGKSEPSLTEIKLMAQALDVTLDWLINGEESPPNPTQEAPAGYILMPAEEIIDMQRRLIKQQEQELQRQKV